MFKTNCVPTGGCFCPLENCLNVYEREIDICVPRKRCLRANKNPFINKTISKAIMGRTSFRNKFLRKRSLEQKRNKETFA